MISRPRKPTDTASSPRFKKQSIRALSEADMNAETSAEFLAELGTSSDRAAGIMASLVVQDALVKLIGRHLQRSDAETMAELLGRDGPLHSFYSSTLVAYALGLIDEHTKKHLNAIRHIRNAFAHGATPISFKTDAVSRECEKLRSAGRSALGSDKTPAKYIYLIACLAIAARLVAANRNKLARDRKRLNQKLRLFNKRLKTISEKLLKIER